MSNFIPKFEYEHPTEGTTTITFVLPPQGDPLRRQKRTKGRSTRSSTGEGQYQLNYTDETFSLDLVFLDKAIVDEVEKLFDDHASLENEFKYFPSSDELEFYTVVWDGSSKRFQPRAIIASGDDFIYDLRIPLRVAI